MLKASRRAPADRDTVLTRAVVDVGVVWSHRVPKPHGDDLPTGVPTNAAFFDAWPVHGLAFATPAATARRAQVLIMMYVLEKGYRARCVSCPPASWQRLFASVLVGTMGAPANSVPQIESEILTNAGSFSEGLVSGGI